MSSIYQNTCPISQLMWPDTIGQLTHIREEVMSTIGLEMIRFTPLATSLDAQLIEFVEQYEGTIDASLPGAVSYAVRRTGMEMILSETVKLTVQVGPGHPDDEGRSLIVELYSSAEDSQDQMYMAGMMGRLAAHKQHSRVGSSY